MGFIRKNADKCSAWTHNSDLLTFHVKQPFQGTSPQTFVYFGKLEGDHIAFTAPVRLECGKASRVHRRASQVIELAREDPTPCHATNRSC